VEFIKVLHHVLKFINEILREFRLLEGLFLIFFNNFSQFLDFFFVVVHVILDVFRLGKDQISLSENDFIDLNSAGSLIIG
jgi:hypothetical protein